MTPTLASAGWSVRVRTVDGAERHLSACRFTQAQAAVAADSLRRDIARHGPDARDADLGPAGWR